MKGGWRAKLKAEDGNEIDSMFIDNRSNDRGNGQILVRSTLKIDKIFCRYHTRTSYFYILGNWL